MSEDQSEYTTFVKNFIKKVKSIINSEYPINLPEYASSHSPNVWTIKRNVAGLNRFKSSNPNIDGMTINISFGSNKINVSRMNTHIGWHDYRSILYADPSCTPESVASIIMEVPENFLKAWEMCKEASDEFNIEIR